MSLAEYKKKRSFNRTPEPKGKITQSKKKLHFVIHKHAASHLHYDLRLEMKGKLKSWAVPKGPSLNPEDKRLAVMVEDHPYDYKDFEGVIPQGNYGAGQVIIWDEGFYDLEKDSSIKKGAIKFILHGKKLRGAFRLVKIKKTEDNWLLFKVKDRYASDQDILKKDRSVRSRKKIKLPTRSMPTFIHPMLAHRVREPFNRSGWIFEIKWDGFRILAYLQKGKVKLISRKLQNYTEVYTPVSEELSSLDFDAIFDGEMVVVDKKGRSRFQLLQQYEADQKGTLIYYIFDLIWLNGRDLRHLPLKQRRELLTQFLPTLQHVLISEYIETNGIDFFKTAVKHGLEGIMAKNADSEYMANQRSRDWLKIKTKLIEQVIICGYTAPKGSRSHLGALILGMYQNNKLVYVGHVGTGFDEMTRADLKKKLDKIQQLHCPFEKKPRSHAPATWVKPKMIAEISFSEWTNDHHLRQPVFIGIKK